MVSDLYLIAHRCRGEATFDVAERMICPSCDVGEGKVKDDYCEECNDEGYWWILSTCGYRAHPWASWSLSDIIVADDTDAYAFERSVSKAIGPMPEAALDCFPINSPSHKSLPDRSNDLLAKLGLAPKLPPLRRL